jgi:hypothetical protein
MSHDGWRPHLESALCLDLADLFDRGGIHPSATTSGTWKWTRNGERAGAIGYHATLRESDGELRLNYRWTHKDEPRDVEYTIRLSSRPLRYGGRYWYMHCPATGLKARKLYKFGPLEKFLHRTAIRPLPTYASQRVSGCDRVMAQRWALRRKIGDDSSDLFGEPCKPKWMRWRIFERYAERDAELAERENYYLLRFIGRRML